MRKLFVVLTAVVLLTAASKMMVVWAADPDTTMGTMSNETMNQTNATTNTATNTATETTSGGTGMTY